MMHKRAAERVGSAAEVVERLRPWTAAADESTWRQIGQFASAPGERSFASATLADTIVADASEIDTEEQTPGRRADATASLSPLMTGSYGEADDRSHDEAPAPPKGLRNALSTAVRAILRAPGRLRRHSAPD
jgi:hypothetical protein